PRGAPPPGATEPQPASLPGSALCMSQHAWPPGGTPTTIKPAAGCHPRLTLEIAGEIESDSTFPDRPHSDHASRRRSWRGSRPARSRASRTASTTGFLKRPSLRNPCTYGVTTSAAGGWYVERTVPIAPSTGWNVTDVGVTDRL